MNAENMELDQLKRIVEGALLASAEPMTVNKIAGLFELDDAQPGNDDIREALKSLQEDCDERGYELVQVASGWRFQVRQELAPWVNRLWEEKPAKYTRATLETLALIAYRQPITRGDIEEVRGVAVSSNTIKSLMERNWVRIVGHRDVPGRPALYATTKQFLDYFNLKSLEQLPSLSEIRDLDKINEELKFDGPANDDSKADYPADSDDEQLALNALEGDEQDDDDELDEVDEQFDEVDDDDNDDSDDGDEAETAQADREDDDFDDSDDDLDDDDEAGDSGFDDDDGNDEADASMVTMILPGG